MGTQNVQDQVRRAYATAARAASAGRTACCGPTGQAEPAPPITASYPAAELALLPEAARRASLGCGNPLLAADLRPGETVLDLGSGGGIDVLLSARRVGPTGRVYGLDLTDEMLELARRNAAEAGASNVEFRQGTIEQIPLPDRSVDVVISNCVINLSPDKPAVFAEMFRVLRPGGVAVVSSWAPAVESSLMRTVNAVLRETGMITEEPQPVYSSLENPEVFASEMRDAGFAGVSIQRHSCTLSWPSAQAFLEHILWANAPMILLRHELGERESQRCETIMRDYLVEHYRPNTPLTTTALLGIGHRPRE